MSAAAVPVVRRAQWGAAPPRSAPSPLSPAAIDAYAVHYSGSLADELPEHAGCAGRVRGIQHFHQHERGWNDIAYSWLACRHGVVFEGRGWLVQTAATLNHNHHTQAYCFLGADKVGRDDVTPAGRGALSALILNGFRVAGGGRVAGHGAFVATECPGAELTAWVRAEGWKADRPGVKPWPVPVPPEFWAWVGWRRRRWQFPSRLAWLRARPRGVPVRIPPWYWVRAAAMGGLDPRVIGEGVTT